MGATESLSSIDKALDSTETEERRQATSRLAKLDLEAALPFLLRALGDDDWRVRKEATVAARAFVPARALTVALIETLGPGDNVGLRNAAVEVLAGIGHPATIALHDALSTLDADGRKLAVEVLGRSRDASAVDVLRVALGDADDNVRAAAIEAITLLGPVARDRVQEILLATLDDRDRLVRLTALEGLRTLDVPIPWERLERLIEDPTLRVVALSAAALASSPEAARALARALARSRGGAFTQALAALARLAGGPLADDVADALRAEGAELGQRLVALASDASGSIEHRAMALRLAAAARAPGVVDGAFAALAEEMLAEPAQRALKTLGAAALPEMVVHLVDTTAPAEARAALVDVIAEIAEIASESPRSEGRGAVSVDLASRFALVVALRDAARDPERGVAASALSALARLGGADDLALAAEQTLAEARPVALAAEGALSALATRYPMAARTYATTMAQREAFLLPTAILFGALAVAGDVESGDSAFLAHVATTGNTRARRAAVLAVCEIGDAVAMEVLSFALTDEEHDVQAAAARALGRLCAVSLPLRASEILDLVGRSGAPDLVATTVRAIGETMSLPYAERRSAPPAPPAPELVSALAVFARSAGSPVAIAAVDALGQALSGGAAPARDALVEAFDHPDIAVVKAAMFKLAASSFGCEMLPRGLAHASPPVRTLAAELLADSDLPDARQRLGSHLSVELDREVRLAIERALRGDDAAEASSRRRGLGEG